MFGTGGIKPLIIPLCEWELHSSIFDLNLPSITKGVKSSDAVNTTATAFTGNFFTHHQCLIY